MTYYRGASPTSAGRLKAAQRKAKAVELRISGLSTLEVARELGVGRVTAWKYLTQALAETKEEIREHTETLRAIEHRRIEEYIASLRPAALAGDEAAHRALVRWHERLARLLNLDLQPDTQGGPQVLVIDTRAPWERGEVVEGEVVEMAEIEEGGNG